MERKEDGSIVIAGEEVQKVKKILGYIGLSFMGLEVLRYVFRPYGRKTCPLP